MNKQLPDLVDSENIGRSVFSSKDAKRAKNRSIITHKVFLEHLEADSISVDRIDHAPETILAELSIERGQKRKSPQNFYGWAILKVSDAASNGRTVKATPDDTNIYHADIFLNLSHDAERRDEQIQHANELATLAKWRSAPNVSE